ncbi:hypothetical protein BDN70DRAFT_878570 [Pholiota conissans]|uniref:Transmembrane protein n=1 Tax=Pholiota conissans TaxID=109636 RepID=A0A9P6D0T4_9AGAR|nr:hypothetical protein BDN70DRAFT_878570 [Pholiota conissans]
MSASIRVDDTDSNIQYSGNWLPTSHYDSLGSFGPPFQNTLHNATSQASFSYIFTGTSVVIAGTVSSVYATSRSSYTCSIDGKAFPIQTRFSAGNGVTLCEATGLSPKSHILELVAGPSSNSSFLFDYIQYVPSFIINPEDHATVVIPHVDPQLKFAYDPAWDMLSSAQPIGAMTRTTNSTLEYVFNGTSLAWIGFYDSNYPSTDATATYSVDGHTPTLFPLKGISSGIQLNQIFFQTSSLPLTQHRLVVTYQGNNLTTPLTLESLLIQNGSIATMIPPQLYQSASASLITSVVYASATSSPQAQQQPSHSTDFSAIIGGTIGGAAILLFSVFGFLFIRLRFLKRHPKPPSSEFTTRQPNPYTPPARPFARPSSIHKQRPPPARYMPPLSDAGSMRSYDPPTTAPSQNVVEHGSSTRRHHRRHRHHRHGTTAEATSSTPTTVARKGARNERPTTSSRGYVTLHSLYRDNTEPLHLQPPPEVRTREQSKFREGEKVLSNVLLD